MKIKTLILLVLGIFFCFSCKKENTPPVAVFTFSPETGNVDTVFTFDASGCHDKEDGGASVTARGFCWSKDSDPTVLNEHTVNGSGTGSYSGMITPLDPNTEYKIRAYATNSSGTAYGDQLVFRTNESIEIPLVTTKTDVSPEYYSAQAGGVVISDGGEPVARLVPELGFLQE